MSKHERQTLLAMALIAYLNREMNSIEISRWAFRLACAISLSNYQRVERCDLRMISIALDTMVLVKLPSDEELMP